MVIGLSPSHLSVGGGDILSLLPFGPVGLGFLFDPGCPGTPSSDLEMLPSTIFLM